MPPPGDLGPARLTVTLRDLVWDGSTRRSRGAVGFAADRLNHLQFLTIRRYLMLVFAALVACCWCSRYGSDRRSPGPGRADAAGAAAGAAADRPRAQGQGAPAARRGPSVLQPYRDLARLLRKEVVLAENASWLFRVAPYLIFAATWVAAALVPTFATGLDVQLDRRPHRHHRAARLRPLLSGAGRHGCRHQLRRHRLQPRGDDRLAGRAGDDHDRVLAGAGRRLDPAVARSPPSCARPMSACASRSAWRWSRWSWWRLPRTPASRSTIPATHLELTMVHEAMVLEYSGRHLAMIELAALAQAPPLHLADRLHLRALGPGRGRRRPGGLCGRRDRLSRQARRSAAFCSRCSRPRSPRCGCSGCREFLGAALMLGLLGTLLLFVSRSL